MAATKDILVKTVSVIHPFYMKCTDFSTKIPKIVLIFLPKTETTNQS